MDKNLFLIEHVGFYGGFGFYVENKTRFVWKMFFLSEKTLFRKIFFQPPLTLEA